MEIHNGPYRVYYHQNLVNGKFYVGVTKQDVERRWRHDGSGYKYHNPLMWRAICKYGWENFDHVIFASGLTKEEAENMEIILIEKLNSIKNGYNIYPGGQLRSEENIEANRIGHIGLHVGGKNPRAKKVKCLESGLEFDTISDAAEYYKVHRSEMSLYLNHGECKSKKLKDLHFEFLDKIIKA